MNYQNINHNPERISNLRPFINNYNWKDIYFPAGYKDYSVFNKNNSDIAINILFVPCKTKEIRQAYISKHKNERDTHVNLVMITDETGNWHYLAVKRISGLLREITSTHNGDFYCLNCLHSYLTEKKLRKHEKYVKTWSLWYKNAWWR